MDSFRCNLEEIPGLTATLLVALVSRTALVAMVIPSKAGEAPVKPIDVWANQTKNKASLLGVDSPLFGATTMAYCQGCATSLGRAMHNNAHQRRVQCLVVWACHTLHLLQLSRAEQESVGSGLGVFVSGVL